MSSVTSISSNKTAYAATDSSASSATAPTTTTGQQTLGINDFMKLLATQFQQQDPLKPMDDTAFIAQTAQFTSLQQTNTLVQQITQLNAAQSLTQANSYLGLQVTVNTSSGQTDTGNVTKVDASGSAPQIIVNGQSYPLSSVVSVQPPSTSSSAPVVPPSSTPSS